MIPLACLTFVAVSALFVFERTNARTIAALEKANIRLINHNRQLAFIAKAKDVETAQAIVAHDRLQTVDLEKETTAVAAVAPEEPFAPAPRKIITVNKSAGQMFELVGDESELPEGLENVELSNGRPSAS